MPETPGWKLPSEEDFLRALCHRGPECKCALGQRSSSGSCLTIRSHTRAVLSLLNAAQASPCPENGQLRKLVEEVVNVAASYPMRDCDLFPHALAERGWFQRAKDALALPENGQNGWRDDMENAPKDGTRFLAWCDAAESEPGIQEMKWHKRCFVSVIDHPIENACPRPTHWMPSPAPPSASKPCATNVFATIEDARK